MVCDFMDKNKENSSPGLHPSKPLCNPLISNDLKAVFEMESLKTLQKARG
jgi:hypothetical protein